MRKKRYNNTTNQKLHKEFCEICGITDKEVLHWHHLIERTEINTCNDPFNIGIICSNCHNKTHAGIIKIIGVFPSTAKYGRTLVYEISGKKNIEGIDEPLFKHINPQMSVPWIKDEEEI